MKRRPRDNFLDRIFEPLLNHDCASRGHSFRPEGHCFYCAKKREEVDEMIAAGEYQFDAITYLDFDPKGDT